MASDNKQVIRRLFEEAWNRGQLDVLEELIDPKYQAHDPLLGVLDLKGYRSSIKSYRTSFSGLNFVIDEMVSDGNVVATRWTARGTHTGPFGALAPTGKTAEVKGISFSELKNGKLIRTSSQMDTLGLMQQLGAAPTLGVPAVKPVIESVARL